VGDSVVMRERNSGAGPGAHRGGGGMWRCVPRVRTGDNPGSSTTSPSSSSVWTQHGRAVTETSIWLTSDAGADFEPNAAAPIMRTQNIVHLVNVITDWYKKAPAAL